MPISQFFTNSDDSYVANQAAEYYLTFLNGNDTLTINGATHTSAAMGSGDDRVTVRTGTSLLYGDGGNDRFDVYVGNATAYGGADNDLFYLRGGDGLNLYGEDGNDQFVILAGGVGILLNGGTGNDVFRGGLVAMSASISGGAGNDSFYDFRTYEGFGITIYGGGGNDLYRADPVNPATFVEYENDGTDTVQVARYTSYTLGANMENLAVVGFVATPAAEATLVGNELNNTMYGWNGGETFSGLGGNDRIFAKGGSDTVDGGDGNDLLDGGAGDDALTGGDGNDIINGRAGDDAMSGDAGNDSYYVDSLGDTVSEEMDEGYDTVRVTITNYTLTDNVERLIYSGQQDAQLIGNDLDNDIFGGAGLDQLYGGFGNDRLYGNDGNDLLIGDSGDDFLFGGAGEDELWGDYGNDYLDAGPTLDGGYEELRGLAGDDTYVVRSSGTFIYESSGFDTAYIHVDGFSVVSGVERIYMVGTTSTVYAGVDDNIIYANDTPLEGYNIVYAGEGSDTLYGSSVADGLAGEGGDDILQGYGGEDALVGGAGADAMWGGTGTDNFQYGEVTDSAVGSADFIYDFEGGETIDLSFVDAVDDGMIDQNDAFTWRGSDGSTGAAGDLWYVSDLSDATHFTVYGDVDGDGVADLQIEVFKISGGTLSVSDFYL